MSIKLTSKSGGLAGSLSINATEVLTITEDGNVGIGTTNPETILHLVNPSSYSYMVLDGSSGCDITLRKNGVNQAYIGSWVDNTLFVGAGYSSGVGNIVFETSNGSERMRVTESGEVWIAGTTDRGEFNLQCNGTGVWGAGAYTNGSDAALKQNIESLETGLETIKKIRPVTFNYKNDIDYTNDTNTQVGFIAQELQEALEGEVYKDSTVISGNEYLSVAYQNLIPVLVKAIQELKSELDETKNELQELKSTLGTN